MTTNDQDISRALGRLEGKMDSLLRQFTDLSDTIKSHDGRIGTLENWRSSVKGSVVVMASIASIVVSVLLKLLLKGV